LSGSDVPEPAAYRSQVAAELTRLLDVPEPAAWAEARQRWERLGFPFHAAVCGWREADLDVPARRASATRPRVCG
jgi:hypothetical protein